MSFVAIIDWSGPTVTKYLLPFATLAEAERHCASIRGLFPEAFAAEAPAGQPWDWAVDGTAKTVAFDSEAANRERARQRLADERMIDAGGDVFNRVLIKWLAIQHGKTEAQIRAEFKALL